jgi:hypothetical protein
VTRKAKIRRYEHYPLSSVLFRNAFEILLYAFGAVILAGFGTWVAIAYLAYCALMAVWTMRFRCKYCYYYGKTCPMGVGRIASRLFKPGDNEDFRRYAKFIAPVFLVWLLPILGGVVLLFIRFSVMRIVILALFVIARFALSGKVVVQLGCVRCKQQDDCPAYQTES